MDHDIDTFESQHLVDTLASVDNQHRKLVQRMRHAKENAQQWLQEGLKEYEDTLTDIRSQLSTVSRANVETLEVFEGYIMEEIALFTEAIRQESMIREETDDGLVRILNEWNAALQKGFSSLARD